MNQQFFKAIDKVLEKIFFMLPEPVSDIDAELLESYKNTDFYYIDITFGGDFKGNAWFYLPLEMSIELVCNALGIDELENPENWIEDDLKECINMIFGNFFSDFYPNNSWDISFTLVAKEQFQPEHRLEKRDNCKVIKIERHHFFYQVKFNEIDL